MNPNFFIIDIEKETIANKFYRKVLYTSKNQQLVVMSIAPKSDIPKEIHNENDQFIRIEKGNGSVHIGENEEHKYDLKDGSAFIVPAGTYHRVINNSNDQPLQLYTIYSPPHHPKDKIDIERPIEKSDLEYSGKTLPTGGKCGCEMQGGTCGNAHETKKTFQTQGIDYLYNSKRRLIY